MKVNQELKVALESFRGFRGSPEVGESKEALKPNLAYRWDTPSCCGVHRMKPQREKGARSAASCGIHLFLQRLQRLLYVVERLPALEPALRKGEGMKSLQHRHVDVARARLPDARH
jgi:hypothetical protein